MSEKYPDEFVPGAPLRPDLQRTLEEFGPERYAQATAADFATGGKYNAQPKKPPYALT